MGTMLMCKCDKCGYTFEAAVGIGFLYPKVYSETVRKVKEGQFGEQGKEFFEAYPDGAISCERIVVQCNDCRQLICVPELTLYVPKEEYIPNKQNKEIPWSSAFSGKGYEYVAPTELHDHYQLFEEYDHRCPYCNGHTTVVPGFTENVNDIVDTHVCCPQCGSVMKINFSGWWD